jgi:type IX secretion system PorP/SprF family membrane protein
MKKIVINKIVLLIVALGFYFSSNAQQTPEYTQYMYNTMSINPGYTSSIESLEANLLYRSQWVGIDGAPKTANFSILTPFSYDRMGIGLNIVNDKIGPANETLVTVNYAYNVPLSEIHTLALGVNAGAKFMHIDWSKGVRQDNNDPYFANNISEVKPALGFGAYFFTDNYFIGLSVPNFIKSNYYNDIQQAKATDVFHYYLIAGYVFDLTENIKFKPSIMAKAVQGSPLSYDFSANFLFHEKFTLGIAYRIDDSISGLAGFQITNSLFIGYAYDYSTSNLSNYNHGSHEVFLKFKVFDKNSTLKSPRFF